MRRLTLVAALLAMPFAALAQPASPIQPPPVTDEQVEQAHSAALQSENRFYLLAAQRLTTQLAEAASREAWWSRCVADPICVTWATAKPAEAPSPAAAAPQK